MAQFGKEILVKSPKRSRLLKRGNLFQGHFDVIPLDLFKRENANIFKKNFEKNILEDHSSQIATYAYSLTTISKYIVYLRTNSFFSHIIFFNPPNLVTKLSVVLKDEFARNSRLL